MIKKTALKEIKESLREGRIKIALLLVLLLLGAATFISSRQYSTINEQYLAAREAERAIWDNQGEKNPHSAAHYGTYAFKPKYPLSLLDQGIDKYAGTSIFLEAHKRNEAQFSAAADQTGLARFGDLTPEFILLFILPMLIILLGYNSFTKEREMGTLTLVKSQGVSRTQWLAGKWIGLFTPVFLITTVLFLTAGLLLSNLRDFGVFSWSSLGVLYAIYLVYYVVFSNVVLLFSALTKKSGISLVLSLSFWILACFAAPKAASNLAENKYPFPTRQEFAANVLEDKKQGLDGHDPWNKQAKELERNVLNEFGVDSLHQLPFNFDAYRMQKGEEHEAEIYYKHYGYLKKQFQGQTKIYRQIASVSPFLPTRFLSMAVAHTDYGTHWDFSDAAEEYRVETQRFLNDDFAQNSKLGEWGYQADPDFWQKLPVFQYDPPELPEVLKTNSSNITILGTWVVVTSLFLLWSIKKI